MDDNPFRDIEEALGAVLHLMASSEPHAGQTLRRLHERVLPPVVTRQFRLVRNDRGEAIAFASWAMASDEVEKKMTEGGEGLMPSEWQSGETAMLMDVVCKDQDFARSIVARLKREVFPNRVFKVLRKGPQDSKPTWREVGAGG